MSGNDKVGFDLPKGFLIAGYRIIGRLGSGCTADVYKVEEIFSGAVRSIKIFENYKDGEKIEEQRRVSEYAQGLEKLSGYKLTPYYYHSGHVYLDDKLGNYFVVQEYIEGDDIDKKNVTGESVNEFLEKLGIAHRETGLIIGDWESENLLVTSHGIRLIDADLGTDKGSTGNAGKDYLRAKKLLKSYL